MLTCRGRRGPWRPWPASRCAPCTCRSRPAPRPCSLAEGGADLGGLGLLRDARLVPVEVAQRRGPAHLPRAARTLAALACFAMRALYLSKSPSASRALRAESFFPHLLSANFLNAPLESTAFLSSALVQPRGMSTT